MGELYHIGGSSPFKTCFSSSLLVADQSLFANWIITCYHQQWTDKRNGPIEHTKISSRLLMLIRVINFHIYYFGF
jgi:hypothetical protein